MLLFKSPSEDSGDDYLSATCRVQAAVRDRGRGRERNLGREWDPGENIPFNEAPG